MADKARTTFPIAVNFTEGELPTASKMNGLSRQTKQGLGILEHIVGDAWNQAGDSVLQGVDEARNMIPNLSRYLGATRLVNPRIPSLPDIEEYTHQCTASAGNYELQLPYPPALGTSYTWTGTTPPTGSPEASKGDVTAANEWWIDTDTGRIVTFNQVNADWKLAYKPVVDGDLGADATWNVIPDPDTAAAYNFKGVKIEYKNGTDDSEGYLVYLPPRQPLDARRVYQSPQEVVGHHADNMQTSPSSGDRLFWQDDSVAADVGTDAEHYRYNLPKVLTENWGQAATIPQGLVYLWDPVGTGTIIEGLTFSAEDAATPRTWVLRVTGSNLQVWLNSTRGQLMYPAANLTSGGSDHTASQYPNGGLRLITIGTSVSQALSELLAHFLNHDHGTPSSLGNAPVSHNQLTETFDADGFTPQLDSSGLNNDAHPQYLHRSGYNTNRDKYNNALLGDLVMASSNSSSNYQNLNADSRAVFFGSASGHKVYFNSSNDCLTVQTPNDGEALAFNRALSVRNWHIAIGHNETYFEMASNLFVWNVGTVDWNLAGNLDVDVTSGDITLDTGSGDINIDTASGDMTLAADTITLTANSTITEDIVVPLTSSDANANLTWLIDGAGYTFSAPSAATTFLIDNVWPHLCTINSVTVYFRYSAADTTGITDNLDIVLDRLDFDSSPPRQLMKSTTVLVGDPATNNNIQKSLTSLSNNNAMSRARHTMTIQVDYASGSPTAFHMYPFVKLNVSYTKLLHWPANT